MKAEDTMELFVQVQIFQIFIKLDVQLYSLNQYYQTKEVRPFLNWVKKIELVPPKSWEPKNADVKMPVLADVKLREKQWKVS